MLKMGILNKENHFYKFAYKKGNLAYIYYLDLEESNHTPKV